MKDQRKKQMQSDSEKKMSMLPIFITVFIDLLGYSIVIPIFAPLFLDTNGGIFPPSYTFASRTIILGLLTASYPIAQFFGAPIIGGWSDKVGRKKALLISLAGTCVAYVIFGYGIVTRDLFLLFSSRIVDGFTGGNISIAMAAIADLSDEKEKSKNFGLIGMAFGLGFIMGPFIGGKLTDPSVVSWFDFATPFWFAAVLCFANIMLVVYRFKETLTARRETKLHLLAGIKNVYRAAFHFPNLRSMFLVVFILTFGFTFFITFSQVFYIEKFHYNQVQIGELFAYIGLWVAITQGIINRKIAKMFSPNKILLFSILLLGVSFFPLLFINQAILLYVFVPFIAIFQGLVQPNYTAVISNLTDKNAQGEVLGLNQSIQSLGIAIPPVIAGFIVALDISLPITVSGIATIVAWVVFVIFFKRTNVSHEKVGYDQE